jgi:hypothetical protein
MLADEGPLVGLGGASTRRDVVPVAARDADGDAALQRHDGRFGPGAAARDEPGAQRVEPTG